MNTTTDSSESTAEQSKRAVTDVARHARGEAGDVASSARKEARSVARDAKDQAADVVGTARGELRTQAAGQAQTLSATLSDIARQLSDMAEGSSDPHAQVASLARSAADTLSQRAERIDEGGIDGVVDDVRRFARNRPGAFLLGSIAAGFALGRLAKHADLRQMADNAKDEVDTDTSTPELGSRSIDLTDTSVPAGSSRPLAGGVTP